MSITAQETSNSRNMSSQSEGHGSGLKVSVRPCSSAAQGHELPRPLSWLLGGASKSRGPRLAEASLWSLPPSHDDLVCISMSKCALFKGH